MNACALAPAPIHCETLTPNAMVIGGGAFARWFSHEGKALSEDGISVLVKDILESSPAPSITWGYNEKPSVSHDPHQTSNLLAPWSWTSQLTVYIFVIAAWMKKNWREKSEKSQGQNKQVRRQHMGR